MCVCVCVFVSLDIHIYTHIYAYVGSKEGGNIHPQYISSTTFHPKVDEYPTCRANKDGKKKQMTTRLEV